MKKTLIAAFVLLVAACAAVGDLTQIQTATQIGNCQAAARLADAGDNLHTYNECMKEAGLHD